MAKDNFEVVMEMKFAREGGIPMTPQQQGHTIGVSEDRGTQDRLDPVTVIARARAAPAKGRSLAGASGFSIAEVATWALVVCGLNRTSGDHRQPAWANVFQAATGGAVL